jgi:hypothetical protein
MLDGLIPSAVSELHHRKCDAKWGATDLSLEDGGKRVAPVVA